jgi:hypothetical protein
MSMTRYLRYLKCRELLLTAVEFSDADAVYAAAKTVGKKSPAEGRACKLHQLFDQVDRCQPTAGGEHITHIAGM